MTLQRRNLPPLDVADVPKDEARTQVAALCWRMGKKGPEILLVTSRDSGRWIVPKGWPAKGLSQSESAEKEAWEEAGAKGKVRDACLGLFAYHKELEPGEGVPCVVAVFPLKVSTLADDFPERTERKRRWFRPEKAAMQVDEPELAALLAAFDPKRPAA